MPSFFAKSTSKAQDIELEWNGTNYSASGVPVKVLSIDSDEMVEDLGGAYGKTQGDATLGGAVYGVYKGETLVDTYTTDQLQAFIQTAD